MKNPWSNPWLSRALPAGILSGVLIGVSYPPFKAWTLFFCCVPLWIFLRQAESLKDALKATFVTSFLLTLIGFHWVAHTAIEFGHLPAALSYAILLAFCSFASLHILIAGLLSWKLGQRLSLSRFWFFTLCAVLTATVEWIYPMIFPWNFGYPLLYSGFRTAQLAEFFGFTLLSGLVLFVNGLLATALDRYLETKSLRKAGFTAASALLLMLCCEGAGVLTEARLPATDSKLRVLFVQPNVGNYDKYLAERGPQYQVPVVEKMLASTKPMLELARWPNPTLDLIVWPETAYPVALDPGLNYPLAKRLFDFIAAFKVPLITGAYSNEKETNPLDGAANGVFGIDASGQVTAAYRKHILLAFGEYIPGAEIFPWLKTLVPEIGDFKRGRGAQVFTLGAQKYFPMICYEALAPDYVAKAAKLGAHFLVNPTNDSWYGLISEPQQHMIMAAGRALELRLPLLRPTNTGLSVAVDAHGQIQTVGPQKVEMAQVLEVPYSSHPRPTVFSKLVPWMTSLLLGLSILVILLGRLFRVRTQI